MGSNKPKSKPEQGQGELNKVLAMPAPPPSTGDLFAQFGDAAKLIERRRAELDRAQSTVVGAQKAYAAALEEGQALRDQLRAAIDAAVPTSMSAGSSDRVRQSS